MLDTTGDHLCFDGKESITIGKFTNVIRGTDGVVHADKLEHSIANTLRREITIRQSIDSGGRLKTSDVFWELWVEEFPQDFEKPKKGMTIIPDNNPDEVWQVLAVDFSTIKNRWRCHCRK